MSEQPTQEQQVIQLLTKIEKRLASVEGMLIFFTILTVFGLILGACNVILSF